MSNKKYFVRIYNSWGSEEDLIECTSKMAAWEKIMGMTMSEANNCSLNYGIKIPIIVDRAKLKISINYPYDNSFVYYEVKEVEFGERD